MKNFTYNISTKVFFGENTIERLGKEIKNYSERILIVYGSERIKRDGLFYKISEQLKMHNIFFKELGGIKPNPSLTSVHDGISIIKENKLDFVLAVGGGSVIDASKAMAAGAAMDIDPWLFCKREKGVKKAFPLASILTLAATGSEMNGNSVISNEETGEKLPFGSDLTRPVFSVLDPKLTFSVPKNQTAAGVADIFTHVAEQYFEPVNSAGVLDRISEAIMRSCIQYGRAAIDDPENYEARANLMWASSLALNGLVSYGKSGGDWATHYIEHELSAAYDITHGLGLAIVLPQWMKFVLSDDTVDRFAMFAQNVFDIKLGDKFEQAKAGIEATADFFRSLDIPDTLTKIEIDDSKFDSMAKQATQFGEIGSFSKLNTEDVKEILKMCL
jgi:butanol dehydrogenase